MRKLIPISLALLACLIIPSSSQTAAKLPTSYTFSYDFTAPLSNACPTPLPTVAPWSCVSSFTVYAQLNNAPFGTAQTVTLPTVINATGPTTGIVCNNCIPALTQMGTYLFCVVPNYASSNGPGAGATSCVTQVYPLAVQTLTVQ